MLRRDIDDWESPPEATGDPAIFYLGRVVSSTGSTAAATTFLCDIVEIDSPETEGAALTVRDTGNPILATNITRFRPPVGTIVPIFKSDDRFVMVYY